MLTLNLNIEVDAAFFEELFTHYQHKRVRCAVSLLKHSINNHNSPEEVEKMLNEFAYYNSIIKQMQTSKAKRKKKGV